MDFALKYRMSFDASHQVPGVDGCDKPHGHTYRVTACIEGPLMQEEGRVRRVKMSYDLQRQLDEIGAELDERDLDKMMVGSVTVPEVIAGWILERLPNADWVEVEVGWRGETGWARRTKR